MDNPGVYSLAAQQLGAAMAQNRLTATTDLEGMTAVTLEADFKYGSGSGTAIAIVATTFDDGTTWRHVARFEFATTSLVKHANLEGLLSLGITSYADLVAEGVNDGRLGNQLALFLQTTGSYTDTTLSVRASVR